MHTPILSQQKAEQLALDILELARSTLLIKLRFLEPALCQLPFDPDPETTFATDGFCFYYHFAHVLKTYRQEPKQIMRDYLHTMFHCIFHHPFLGANIDPDRWNLSCDIAVEAALSQLDLPELSCQRSKKQRDIITKLENNVTPLTAEKLYRYFRESNLSFEEMAALHSLFAADEHDLWYTLSQSSSESDSAKEDKDEPSHPEQDEQQDSDQASPGEEQPSSLESDRSSPSGSDGDEKDDGSPTPSGSEEEQQKQWQDISSRIQTDLTTLSHQYGEKAGILLENLHACTREKTDYREFLRKFSVLGEENQLNDDEFDYIYYTYGLELYRDIPLIEPLEYRETKKIRDFVIAIDVSASVKGDLLANFLQKTWEILSQEETFFQKINLHLVCCDTSIQKITVIRCQEDLEKYVNTLLTSDQTIQGFGGTDFRPIFSYIDEKRNEGELGGLKGLLYFTDGDGVYPQTPPDYPAVFVLPEECASSAQLPVWVIRLILEDVFTS